MNFKKRFLTSLKLSFYILSYIIYKPTNLTSELIKYDIFIIILIERKYKLQFIDSFKILEYVKRLLYLLDILNI